MRKFLVDRTRIENVNVVEPEAEVANEIVRDPGLRKQIWEYAVMFGSLVINNSLCLLTSHVIYPSKSKCGDVEAVSRSRRAVVVSTREIQIGKKLYRIKKFRDGTTSLQRSFCRGLKANNKSEAVDPSTSKPDALFNDQPTQVKPETDEKTKVYYHAIGKLEFLLMNYRRGLQSMLKFLEKQAKLKTYKNIEIREIEFGKQHFRVENFGGATTIERILKVKNDV